MPSLKLGTRGSPLAIYQATAVARLVEERTGVRSEIVVIRTSGDRLAESPLSEAGGKRLFVKELEDALLAGTIDLAVHSSKDMSAVLPGGLGITAVLPREDPRDALVLPAGRTVGDGPGGIDEALAGETRIGTSSVRRAAQLAALYPAARFLPIRGNLGTRLHKLDAGNYDALVLAAAGLLRLDQGARISALLPVERCVPAPGQGIIAVETRTGDKRVAATLAAIDDAETGRALLAERAVVARLGGGCQMPIGAYARIDGDRITVTGVVIAPDGSTSARAEVSGAAGDAAGVGARVADDLLARGADAILDQARRAFPAAEERQE
jgi:hydroxymethylbilane synthase